MTRRILDVVGVLALLGLAGGGVAAFVATKQHVHVTIAGETGAQRAGPDPVALLRDDVAALRTDLDALARTLSKNFETLAAAGDDAAGDRAKALDAAVTTLRGDLRRLEEAQAAASTRGETDERARAATDASMLSALADVSRRLDAIEARRALDAAPPPARAVPPAAVVVGPATAPPPQPAIGTAALPPPGRPEIGAPAAGPSPATPAVADARAGATPARRRSFLSFHLPSESLDLHGRMKYEVVDSLSRVGFDAKSTLHDFSGVTNAVSGTFVARLAQPGDAASGKVVAQVASLDTQIQERDSDMLKTLEATRFPTIEFAMASFEATATDPATLASSGVAHGTLTLHGVAREVTVPLRISVDESRRVLIEGEVPVRLADYGLHPPSAVGFIKMNDEVRVWVAIRARAVGPAE